MSPTFFLFPNARVVYANTYRFSSAQRVLCGPVESRMLLWCREGTGSIVANGLRSAMVPGDFWLLPWGHTIEYLAARNDPFHLGGIHLVPEHDGRSDPIFDVAHHAASPLAGHPDERMSRWTGWISPMPAAWKTSLRRRACLITSFPGSTKTEI